MGNRLAPASPETSRRNLLLNAMAGDAERESMRFMAFCADRLVLHLNPSAGDKILDVACGVGAVTLAASQAVGPSGRVVAIDSADNMLASLDAKVRQFGIANIDMHSMDAAQLDFRRDYFQHTVCALRLCWLSDPRAACAEWVRVTRPGGSVNLAVLAPQAFQPQAGLLQQRVAGLAGSSSASLPWAHLALPDVLRSLLADAGLVDVRVHSEQLGYHSE